MKIHQINVGQGHTTYIELADGYRVVVDVDTWACVVDPIAYLERVIPPDRRGNRRIDLLIVTHPHRDHSSGVARLLDQFEVAEVWETGHRLECEDDWYSDLIDALESANAEVVAASSEPVKVTSGGAEVRVFAPSVSMTVTRPGDKERRRDVHDQCMVVSIREGERSFLVVGDSRWREWDARIVEEYGNNLTHEVFLASHHGSRTFFRDDEDDEEYKEGIHAVAPELVLVSVGENDFGHPHDDAVEIYASVATAVLRTDELGTLVATGDDDGWTVQALGDIDGKADEEPQEVYVTTRSSLVRDLAAVGAGVAVGAAAGGVIRYLRDRAADERPRPRHWGV